MTDMKPCPFCGKPPTTVIQFGYVVDDCRTPLYAVRHSCRDRDEPVGHGTSKAGAIENWNKRAESPAQ